MNTQALPYYLISVFTGPQARGNPAAVILAPEAVPAEKRAQWARTLMQPATTFIWPKAETNDYAVHWHAPDAEIPLCGHGAMAAAAALWAEKGQEALGLDYGEGTLPVGTEEGRNYGWLPALSPSEEAPVPPKLAEALGVKVEAYYPGPGKQVVLVDSPETVANMRPDFAALAQLEPFSYAVTAADREVDFVSRTLVPKVWQREDHATGSSHAALMPFWGARLGKKELRARQLSPRGGWLRGEWQKDRVRLWSDSQILIAGKIQL